MNCKLRIQTYSLRVGQIIGVLGEKADYDTIKNRLKAIRSVGYMTEQIDVAQLVARHLCKIYRSQLFCLKPSKHSQLDTDDLSKELLSSRWWWCCCYHGYVQKKQYLLTTMKQLKKFETVP